MSATTTALESGGVTRRGGAAEANAGADATADAATPATTQELLVEHLDRFLLSVESRLDTFEQYFKLASSGQLADEDAAGGAPPGLSRRSSAASLTLLTTYLLANLRAIYLRMGMIKAAVLRSLANNLEHLYAALEEHYQYLSGGEDDVAPLRAPLRAPLPLVDTIREKILTTIDYFDAKFTQVDALIQARTPQDDFRSSTFRHFKYFNFNKALKASESAYLHYYQLPLNWRENRYIIHGYRFLLQHRQMLRSIFRLNHNELANIWTHIGGAAVVVYLMCWHFPATAAFARNRWCDNAVMYAFLAAALECMVSLVVWHTYLCFAHFRVRLNCACIDYTGITVLITASVVAAEYCLLYAHPRLLQTYVGFLLLCGGTGFWFNWLPYFDRPDCRGLRIGFFMGLAFMGASTFFVHLFYYGVLALLRFFFPLVYKSFVWYCLGVVFYGGLIPERWRYDVVINDVMPERSAVEVIEGKDEHSGQVEMEEIAHECARDDYEAIVARHFPSSPRYTKYRRDFMSLWWVDYVLASHNIWHVCVLLGVLGHYLAVVRMFELIER